MASQFLFEDVEKHMHTEITNLLVHVNSFHRRFKIIKILKSQHKLFTTNVPKLLLILNTNLIIKVNLYIKSNNLRDSGNLKE